MALTFTPQAELGLPLPSFELPGLDGSTHRDTEFRQGQVLLIMFICNHCPYVKAIEDRLINLARDLQKQNVQVVAICSNDADEYGEDSFENLKRRAQEKQFPFLYLHDPTQQAARDFGAVCTPDFFVYDQRSQLQYRGRLDDSWKDPNRVTKRELYEAVQALLVGQSLSPKQIPSMGCNIKWIHS